MTIGGIVVNGENIILFTILVLGVETKTDG